MALTVNLAITGDASGAVKASLQAREGLTALGKKSEEAASAWARGDVAATRALQSVASGGKQARGGLQLANAQLQNMQFQLQDIAVGVASGQGFGRILLQQGSQIVQMFGPGQGVQGALRAVGSGIGRFISNPLNLALLGFSGLAVAGELAFKSIGGGVEDADSALEQHETLIKRIREAYGDAAKGAEEYARESTAVLRLQLTGRLEELRAELQSKASGLFEAITQSATPLSLTELGLDFGRKAADDFAPFQEAIDRLFAGIEAGRPDILTFRADVTRIAETDPSGLNATGNAILSIGEAALEADGKVRQAEAFQRLLGGGIKSTPFGGFREAERESLKKYFDELGVTQEELAGIFEKSGRAAEREAERFARAAEREREAVRGVIESLEFETFAMQLNSREREIANALRSAGTGVRPDDAKRIRELAGGLYDMQAAADAAAERLAELRSLAGDFSQAFLRGIQSGKSFVESLGNAIEQLNQRLLDLALNKGLDLLFSLVGGGLKPDTVATITQPGRYGLFAGGGVCGRGGMVG